MVAMGVSESRRCNLCFGLINARNYRALRTTTSDIYEDSLKEIGVERKGYACSHCVNKLNSIVRLDLQIRTKVDILKQRRNKIMFELLNIVNNTKSLRKNFQTTTDTKRVPKQCKRHHPDNITTIPPTSKYRRILPMPDNTMNTPTAEETVRLAKSTESCNDHMTKHDKQSEIETLDLVKVAQAEISSDQRLSSATELPLHSVKTEPLEETTDSEPVVNQNSCDLNTPQVTPDDISSVQVLQSAIGVTLQPVKTEPGEETIYPEPVANQNSQEINTNQSKPADISPVQVLQTAIGIILQPAIDPVMVANKNSQNLNTNRVTDSLYIVTTNQINPIGVIPVCQMPIQ